MNCRPLKDPPCFTAAVRHRLVMAGFYPDAATSKSCNRSALGREALVRAKVPKLSHWRRWLYGVMARNAVPATEFFRIPFDRVVELGVRVAI